MPGLSYHDIVFVETSSRALRHKPARRKILLLKHANFDNICKNISNWTRDFISSNTTFTPVENLVTNITDSLSIIVSDNVPSKFSTRRLEQCWSTTLTKRMCRQKARAIRKARQTKKSRDWERYLILKRTTQKTCWEAHNNYLIKTLPSDPNGNKRLGALIKSKQHDHLGVALLKEGNIIYCGPIQKANILNRQFISVFTDDTKTSIPDPGSSQYPSMKDITASCEGVVKLLKNLKPHKAAGPDDIPLMLLKEAADEIAPAITLLFQASLNPGNTPSTWHKALVVPIFKKGSKSDASNYRPISLTSVLCNLCEHILHSTIPTHLANHKIPYDAQHGFRKRRSWDTQLLLALNDFARGLEDKSQTDIIFLDFAKALEKVSHQGLLKKAYYYGIRGHTIKWIESFLDNRSQQVVIDGHISIDAKITSGVPQDSVLGPFLFLIYINDLPNCVKNSVCHLFADDCHLYQRIRSCKDSNKLQADLDQLQKWESIWLMEFHTSKCQVISITNKAKPIIGKYQIHDHTLEQVNCAKYLGIYIISKIAINAHVDAIVKKVNSTRVFLARNIPRCCRKVKQMAYTTYIRPTVEYASPVWVPHTKRNTNKIEMVQHRCARYVTGNFDRTSSVTSLLNYLSWPSLEERQRQYRLAVMYRIPHDQVDIHWQSFLIKTSSCTRGHSCRLFVPFCKNHVYASSFFPRTSKDWNNLTFDPADAPSLDTFSRKLRGGNA